MIPCQMRMCKRESRRSPESAVGFEAGAQVNNLRTVIFVGNIDGELTCLLFTFPEDGELRFNMIRIILFIRPRLILLGLILL